MRLRRADAALLAVLLLIAAASGLLWLYSVPFHKGPDEAAHFQIVRFIRAYGRLPVFAPNELWLFRTPSGYVETYAAFPPLAYIVAAAVGWLTDDRSMWAARYVSLGSYLGTVALTFWTARRLFPSTRPVAICSAIIVTFLPQFAFTSGYVNNDALPTLIAAAMLALLVCASQGGARPGTLFGAGLMIGALLITKYTFYGAAAIGAGVAVLLAARGMSRWRSLSALAAGVILMSGWWFVRNVQLYGEVIPSHVIANAKAAAGGNSLFIPIDHGLNLLTMSTETSFWELTLKSFVGVFGFMAVYLDAPYYWTALVLALLGGIGLALRARRGGITRSQVLIGLTGAAILGVTLLLTMVVSLYGEYSPQGRYLFPALIPIALGIAYGWCWLAREVRLARWLPSAATLALVGLNLGSLLFFVVPRNYGTGRESVMVQVDRPATGPLSSSDPIEVAGWSLVEGLPSWRPYTSDVVSRYRHPTSGVSIYVDGPPGVGRFIADAGYGANRPDVANFYGGESVLAPIGFRLLVPPGTLKPGRHKLYACTPSPSTKAPSCNEHDIDVT